MAKLVLHIGQTKTATTSIQSFLHHSSDFLENYGFSYLWRPAQMRSHRYLFHLLHLEAFPQSSRLIDNRLARLKDHGVRLSARSPLELCDDLWSTITDSFNAVSNRHGIISEELLWHLGGFRPDIRRQLLTILRQRIISFVNPKDIVIVAVLRAHPDWCESWHNQLVKDQGNHASVRRFSSHMQRVGAFSYADNLQAWREIFPEACIVARDFHGSFLEPQTDPAISLLRVVESLCHSSRSSAELLIHEVPETRVLQESIHPFLHQYVTRYKPKYKQLSLYRRALKRTSKRLMRYAARHYPGQAFTVLPSDLQVDLTSICMAECDQLDGWLTTPLMSRLPSRQLLPKPLPQRVKTLCEESLRDC